MERRQFSKELSNWARADNVKTLGGLMRQFSKDAYAILILLLMAVPALPIPTGGVTHLFEIITMLLAVQLIIGRTNIWLPKRWQRKSLDAFAKGKAMARLIEVIRYIERFTRPRLAKLVTARYFMTVMGLTILVFTLAAFLAPPFSGLDTLPSLGVVIIALSLIFSDIALFIIGSVVGAIGIGLIIALGSAIYRLF